MWSALVCAKDPQPWLARERTALMEQYLRAAADGAVLPPAACWSRLMRPGGDEWPVGLSRPLADAGTLMCYAMGDSMCDVAGPRPEPVGLGVRKNCEGGGQPVGLPHSWGELFGKNFSQGKFRRQTEKRNFPHEIVPARNPLPPPVVVPLLTSAASTPSSLPCRQRQCSTQ